MGHEKHSHAKYISELTFCREDETKSWKAEDQRCLSASWGAGSREIMKMTRMGCTAQRGGVTSAISIALMPSAHTSTYLPTSNSSNNLVYIIEIVRGWTVLTSLLETM